MVYFDIWPWKFEKTGSADKDSEMFMFSSQFAVCCRLQMASQCFLSSSLVIELLIFS